GSAMEKIAGYSHEETVAFTLNCLANSWNGWWWANMPYQGTLLTSVWKLDNSITIDDQGICYTSARGENDAPYAFARVYYESSRTGGGGSMDLKAEPGRRYMGYTAQPCIKELAVRQRSGDHVSPDDDFAVELYNPYDLPLNLRGYWLYLGPGRLV